MKITALDLFAGHGWGVACKWLGVDEYGVEIMPEAVATRKLHGMETLYHDVWTGLDVAGDGDMVPPYDLLIASPPCQTFSMAGGGAGRKALDEVVGLIDSKAYQDVSKLRKFGEAHDPRTALVLTPLTHAYRDLPRYVILEQVPPVLPVWERVAVEMRSWGYSVWVGILNAEQYGVPQTRKRAILIAKRDPELDGEALPPVPTHSRYYPRDPAKLDEGVLPWVSMAEALGWGMTNRPYLTVAPGTAGGGTDPMAVGGSGARRSIDREHSEGRWSEGEVVVRTSMGKPKVDGRNGSHELDPFNRPSHTVTSKFDSATIVEFVSNDKQANSARRDATEPAPTITAGHDSGNRVWQTQRPATTVAGDSRIWPPGHKVNGADIAAGRGDRYGDRAGTNATRVTIDEAAALQSYPDGFEFAGAKGKQFLQVGNAVPPLLARAVLEAVLGL